MEKLKLPAAISGKRGSPGSRLVPATVRRNRKDPLPKIFNRSTDVEIPKSVWSMWKEDGKDPQLRRALTSDERRALEVRRDELAPVVLSFVGDSTEQEHVTIALLDMFGSFRSMRQTGDEALAIVMATSRALEEFPCWAIEKACRSIQLNGVWRAKDGFGAFDRHWPPNDAEIADAVRKEASLYGDQHRSAVALLEATVETQTIG